MALRISSTPTRLPHTLRDIMDEYFPELLEQSEQCFKKMEELQKKVVLLLSNSQKQIPDPTSETANNLQKMQAYLSFFGNNNISFLNFNGIVTIL